MRFKKASLPEQPVPSRRATPACIFNPEVERRTVTQNLILSKSGQESPLRFPEKENINSIDISGLRAALEFRSGQSGKFPSSVDTL